MAGAVDLAAVKARSEAAARGLVTDGGALTAEGRARRVEVERRTDALADDARVALGDRADRLVELMTPLVRMITRSDSFLRDNPMGLRPLDAVARDA